MSGSLDQPLGAFPATQWSLVDRARQKDGSGFREALSTLLHRYLPALGAHLVIEKRIERQRAEDLLQGFVADKVIEQDLLKRAEQSRGKFRSFLLVTLNHYMISQHRSDAAEKRSPKEGFAILDETRSR